VRTEQPAWRLASQAPGHRGLTTLGIYGTRINDLERAMTAWPRPAYGVLCWSLLQSITSSITGGRSPG